MFNHLQVKPKGAIGKKLKKQSKWFCKKNIQFWNSVFVQDLLKDDVTKYKTQ